ncbi:MAG: histidine phosphatase family protein [Acidimicrobiales bacterium]
MNVLLSERVVASRLVLVRHASTEWSRAGRHTGRTDLPLDEAGREGARELRRRLAPLEAVAVYSSPLKRALETCEIAGFAGRVEVTEDLMEWDYGDYEGKTTSEIWESRPHWELFADGCPNGETAADVGARIDLFLDQIATAPEGHGDIVCFAHGHLLRVLTARWVRLWPEEGRRFLLDAGHLGILGYERETRVVAAWNA